MFHPSYVYVPCPGCKRRMINLSYYVEDDGNMYRYFRCYNGRHGELTFKIKLGRAYYMELADHA